MDVRQRIEAILARDPVVLFMKGTRRAPQCGFSARVVDILDQLLPEYATVDVLADAEMREGIKAFGSWPTLPQLYVKGKLVGGADIVGEMMKAGELAPLLGVEGPIAATVPEIAVSEAATVAFLRFAEGAAKPTVRLAIDRAFEAELDLAAAEPNDVVVELGRLVFAMDAGTARRADGLSIDFVEGPGGGGFRIENPNAPPRVKTLQPEELAAYRKSGKPHLLVDVRTPEEREIANIEGSQLLDEIRQTLEDLDRSTTLVLYCHHGVRSRTAAEHCIRMGFRDVSNLAGGIAAWSARVDPSVPTY
jgi:monothiol glutaredoxin